MYNHILNNGLNLSNNNKISIGINQGDNKGARNYINNSNIINENSSDNDLDNSNLEKEKEKEEEKNFVPSSSNVNISEKEFRRFTLEYIKVLSIFKKGKKGQEININEILDEYNIPKELIEEKKIEVENNINVYDNSDLDSMNENKEDKIDFDNDIQPLPSLNHEMKIVIYLSKPKIIGFNGKLGLFYISPTPVDKNNGYNIVVKNPEDMKVIFKIKIIELITCIRKNEKTLYLQNFGTKILSKTNNEMTFKSGEDCFLVHQGITFLMNNKEDDTFY